MCAARSRALRNPFAHCEGHASLSLARSRDRDRWGVLNSARYTLFHLGAYGITPAGLAPWDIASARALGEPNNCVLALSPALMSTAATGAARDSSRVLRSSFTRCDGLCARREVGRNPFWGVFLGKRMTRARSENRVIGASPRAPSLGWFPRGLFKGWRRASDFDPPGLFVGIQLW